MAGGRSTQVEPAVDAEWTFVGRMPSVTQGWKLYISASAKDFAAALQAARSVLDVHGAPFKFASDINVLRRLNAGLCGYSQIGKSIVVYLDTEVNAQELVRDLKLALEDFRGSNLRPPFAHPIGGRYPLSFRYGAFSGLDVVLHDRTIPDERSRRQDLSALPALPFADALEVEEADHAMNRFLLSYPVFEVLGQAGKGGVYAALDIASPVFREVIVKIGRRHGNLLPDGRDGMDLIAHEHWFYLAVKDLGLATYMPALVDYAEFSGAAALVMERLEGVTLLGRQIEGSLQTDHIARALELLDEFHAAGFIVGDAKLANFIETPDGLLKAIDFESAAPVTDLLSRQQHASFLFADSALLERPRLWEKLHFLYSVMHGSGGHSDEASARIVDLDAMLDRARDLPPVEEYAREIARELCLRDAFRLA